MEEKNQQEKFSHFSWFSAVYLLLVAGTLFLAPALFQAPQYQLIAQNKNLSSPLLAILAILIFMSRFLPPVRDNHLLRTVIRLSIAISALFFMISFARAYTTIILIFPYLWMLTFIIIRIIGEINSQEAFSFITSLTAISLGVSSLIIPQQLSTSIALAPIALTVPNTLAIFAILFSIVGSATFLSLRTNLLGFQVSNLITQILAILYLLWGIFLLSGGLYPEFILYTTLAIFTVLSPYNIQMPKILKIID